jgi:hypothetical protein
MTKVERRRKLSLHRYQNSQNLEQSNQNKNNPAETQ